LDLEVLEQLCCYQGNLISLQSTNNSPERGKLIGFAYLHSSATDRLFQLIENVDIGNNYAFKPLIKAFKTSVPRS